MANRPEKSLRRILREYRFVVLLASLGTLILVVPFIGAIDVRGRAGLEEFGLGLLFIFMLVSAADAVADSRVSRIAAWGLVTPLVAVWVLDLVTGPDARAVAVIRHVLGIVYIGYVIFLILRHLFGTVRVTVDMIAASLCIYFLLAILFAEVYSVMEIVNPGSFSVAGSDTPDATLEMGGDGTATGLYYSLVTLTTLGYGDIVPKTASARMFAAMEAVTGQMYLAVLVARLVGMHIAHSTGRTKPDNGGEGG